MDKLSNIINGVTHEPRFEKFMSSELLDKYGKTMDIKDWLPVLDESYGFFINPRTAKKWDCDEIIRSFRIETAKEEYGSDLRKRFLKNLGVSMGEKIMIIEESKTAPLGEPLSKFNSKLVMLEGGKFGEYFGTFQRYSFDKMNNRRDIYYTFALNNGLLTVKKYYPSTVDKFYEYFKQIATTPEKELDVARNSLEWFRAYGDVIDCDNIYQERVDTNNIDTVFNKINDISGREFILTYFSSLPFRIAPAGNRFEGLESKREGLKANLEELRRYAELFKKYPDCNFIVLEKCNGDLIVINRDKLEYLEDEDVKDVLRIDNNGNISKVKRSFYGKVNGRSK